MIKVAVNAGAHCKGHPAKRVSTTMLNYLEKDLSCGVEFRALRRGRRSGPGFLAPAPLLPFLRKIVRCSSNWVLGTIICRSSYLYRQATTMCAGYV